MWVDDEANPEGYYSVCQICGSHIEYKELPPNVEVMDLDAYDPDEDEDDI